MVPKIRRMYFREKVPLREIARRTGLSRNAIRTWMRPLRILTLFCKLLGIGEVR